MTLPAPRPFEASTLAEPIAAVEHGLRGENPLVEGLESPPGESGTLAEAVRQAMLRDPTYRPALGAARHLSENVGVEPQALNQPVRGCASTSVGRVSLP